MDDCIFCKIVKGEIPSAKVYEDDDVMAFLDIAPANKGHVLVIPKEHFETIVDVEEKVMQRVVSVTKKLCEAVVSATQAKGFNILNNNKKIAGQEVPHVHFHIIPRFEDDSVKFSWDPKKYDDDEMDRFKEEIISLCDC